MPRISDFDVVEELQPGDYVPFIRDGANYKYDLGSNALPSIIPTLAALKALDTTLGVAFYNGATWFWLLGDYTGLTDDDYVVKSDDFPIATGAWVNENYPLLGIIDSIAGAEAAAVAAAAAATAAAEQTAADVAITNAALELLPTRSDKLVDTTIAATTTLAADPDLQVTLAANIFVVVTGKIFYTTTAAADFKWRHTGPASPTRVRLARETVAPGDTAKSGIAVDTAFSVSDIVVTGGAGSGFIEFSGTITNGANAGSFGISWAQNTSDAGNTTVEAGSYIEYTQLPNTATFAFADTGIAAIGYFPASSSGGHNFVTANVIGDSFVETVAHGSKCELQMFGFSGNSYTYTVDGVAQTPITPPNGWSWQTLYTGETDTDHNVNVVGLYYDTDATFRVSSIAPAISRPAALPAFYVLGNTPYTTYGATEGLSATSSSVYSTPPQRLWGSGSGCGLRFKATTTSVRLWCYDGLTPGRIILMQGGVQIADVTPAGTTGGYAVVTIATGLSGSHEYEIRFISAVHQLFAWGLLVDSLDTVAHAAKSLDAYYGDSIVALSQLPSADAREGDAYLLAQATSRVSVRLGNPGQSVTNYGRDNTAQVTGLPVAPTRVFVTFGTNDMYAAVSVPTFQTAYQTMLANIRTGLPSAKIYARGILNTTRNTPTERNTYNAAISAAVTAIADANIVYINTDGWIDATTDTLDGLHPNAGGYVKIAAAQALVL